MSGDRTTPPGKQGSQANANVEYKNIDNGNPVTPFTDENNLMLAKMVGEDDNGDAQRFATDTAGRVKVKDVQFDGTVDIGDMQIMDTSETKIDPATEQTVSSLLTESTFTDSVNGSNQFLIDIENDSVGLFKSSDFTESRTITDVQTGGSQTDELAVGINSDSANLFKASDFTETRNVRELQNQSGIRSSDGYVDPGSSFSALNGGTSLSVPDGVNICIRAHRSNDGQVEVRDTTNNEKVVLLSGEKYSGRIDDISKLEWTRTNSTDEAQWFFER